jgi:hypothetical protein
LLRGAARHRRQWFTNYGVGDTVGDADGDGLPVEVDVWDGHGTGEEFLDVGTGDGDRDSLRCAGREPDSRETVPTDCLPACERDRLAPPAECARPAPAGLPVAEPLDAVPLGVTAMLC